MKFNIHDHIPPMDHEKECDRPECLNVGARYFAGEWLCNQCIYDDVFEEMNERDN